MLVLLFPDDPLPFRVPLWDERNKMCLWAGLLGLVFGVFFAVFVLFNVALWKT